MQVKMANEIKLKIYDLLNKYYNEYKNNPSVELKNKYSEILNIYKNINNKGFASIVMYFESNKVSKEVMDIYNSVTKKEVNKEKENKSNNEKEKSDILFVDNIKQELYKKLIEQYNKAKTDKKEVKQYNYLKDIYSEIIAKKKSIEIINFFKNLKNKVNTENLDERKAILQALQVFSKVSKNMNLIPQNNETKKEEKSPQKNEAKTTKLLQSNDEKMKYLVSISKKAIWLHEKLNKLDPMSQEAISIRNQINDLYSRRETIMEKSMGLSGIYASKELESLEFSYAKAANNKEKPYNLTSNEYERELRNTINELNDLKFFKENSKFIKDGSDYEKKLSSVINKYYNLINSVYEETNPVIKEDSKNPDTSIRCDNLLTYLELYNLNKGYGEFKRNKDSLRIGDEIITASVYDKKISMIKDIIEELVSNSKDKIKSKGNVVTIVDSSRNKEVIAQEFNIKVQEIYNKMMQGKTSRVDEHYGR